MDIHLKTAEIGADQPQEGQTLFQEKKSTQNSKCFTM